MKMKKVGIGLLVAAISLGGTITAFAASDGGEKGTELGAKTIESSLKTYNEGEKMPDIPEGAVQMDKKVINSDEDKASAENIGVTYKTYKEGEKMPDMPEGAVQMNKQIIE